MSEVRAAPTNEEETAPMSEEEARRRAEAEGSELVASRKTATGFRGVKLSSGLRSGQRARFEASVTRYIGVVASAPEAT